MARAWDNPRLQRVMMQVALCAALGITVAVAWWITQVHARALAVTLDTPHQFRSGSTNLVVRLPVGWEIHLLKRVEVEAIETQPRYGQPRTLILGVQPLDKEPGKPPPSAENVMSSIMGEHLPVAAPQPLEILGKPALLFEFRRKGFLSELVACGIVGEPDDPKAVIVIMKGVATLAPADFDLVRSVAGSLAWPDPIHPVPRLTPSVEDVPPVPGSDQHPPVAPPDDDDR